MGNEDGLSSGEDRNTKKGAQADVSNRAGKMPSGIFPHQPDSTSFAFSGPIVNYSVSG
jgi:hypothetical protein